MRKLVVMAAAAAAFVLAGALASYAQTSRGALTLPAATKNFTPIEKAACGPHPAAIAGRSITAFARTADAGARTADRSGQAKRIWRPPQTGGLIRLGHVDATAKRGAGMSNEACAALIRRLRCDARNLSAPRPAWPCDRAQASCNREGRVR